MAPGKVERVVPNALRRSRSETARWGQRVLPFTGFVPILAARTGFRFFGGEKDKDKERRERLCRLMQT